jgi:hypothetical protein
MPRDRDDRETGGGDAPDRFDTVDAAAPQVDDGATDERPLPLLLGIERDAQLGVGREGLSRSPRPIDGLDDPRRPDEVVRDDDDRSAQSTVQVSPAKSSVRRSPSPFCARASSTCAVTSWSCVGRPTRRNTPTGTGYSGHHILDST